MSTPPVILQKGFRPFFLLAALFAVGFLPLWIFIYTGRLQLGAYWDPSTWHGHEMVFGFAVAVVSGFLLTAVSNWTKRVTAVGPALAGLGALWLAGRLAMLLAASLPTLLVAIIDLAYIPALAFAIGRPIILSKSRRNMKFLPILVVLFLTNLAMHLEALGISALGARSALLPALDLIILITLIVSGRIIPLFTRNATRADGIKSLPRVEKLMFTLVLTSIILQAVFGGTDHISASPTLGPILTSVAAILAGLAIFWRSMPWGFRHTLNAPILWVLHIAHAWLALGFILRGLTIWITPLSGSMATHALTIGGIGLMILGMMVRVSLGHTARPIHASRLMTSAFILVILAAFGRTFLPILAPTQYIMWVMVSGTLFAGAFLLYTIEFAPVLVSPRADGKEG